MRKVLRLKYRGNESSFSNIHFLHITRVLHYPVSTVSHTHQSPGSVTIIYMASYRAGLIFSTSGFVLLIGERGEAVTS
jgi:hypothetical protein